MSPQKNVEADLAAPVVERVYSNGGNPPLINLIDKNCKELLDIGCGAGDNAVLVKSANKE